MGVYSCSSSKIKLNVTKINADQFKSDCLQLLCCTAPDSSEER